MAARRLREPIDNGDGTHTVPLTHGHTALIDSCDADRVGRSNWFAHLRSKKPAWYATGVDNGKQIRLHRFILGLKPGDPRQVDHISGDVSDNRRCNLRICSNSQNNRNRQTAIGKVGLKGVCKRTGGFMAAITIDGRRVFLGNFPTAIDAALAYDEAAIHHFGPFAATNTSLGLLSAEASV